MNWPAYQLGDVCQVTMGQAPPGDSYNSEADGVPLIAGAGDFTDGNITPQKFTTQPTRVCAAGDIVMSIRASIGAKVLAQAEYCLGRGVAGLRPESGVKQRFLWHWLTHNEQALAAKGRGATFLQVNKTDISEMLIYLPPIEEQRRIAAILDEADEIRAKRRAQLALLDELPQSLFHEVFWTSDARYPTMPLRDLSLKFSDGPFGSNLKSAHYVAAGVRVIRLQNIGVGEFRDTDKAFITPEHFAELQKHECRPGDVLIATLGDPNLRACLLPSWIEVALNKADCVQMRVDPLKADPKWVCALLNAPETLSKALLLAHGQTRARISMGQLRKLRVPVPPIEEQRAFAERVTAIQEERERVARALEADNELFEALQYRAFRGELSAAIRGEN